MPNNSLAPQSSEIAQRVLAARSFVKSFVVYQLCNSLPPNGSGVGCGYYDEDGAMDAGGIARIMNQYLLDFCFNPEIVDGNALLFLDHCLSHLSNSFLAGRDDGEYFATNAELPGGLAPSEIGRYWRQHGARVQQIAALNGNRLVTTLSYVATYRDDLPGVFTILDSLALDPDAIPPDQPQ